MATKGEIRRKRARLIAFVAVVLTALGVSAGGPAVPKLTHETRDPNAWTVKDDVGRIRHRTVQLRHTIVNDGWFPVTVTGAALGGEGIRLTEVREDQGQGFPLTIRSGGLIRMTTLATVTDCERAEAAPHGLLLRVGRWWGSQTVRPDQNDGWEFAIGLACDR